MISTIDAVIEELSKYADSKRRVGAYKYFQAFPGGYGEGDEFIGVTVPNQRKVAKMFYGFINLPEIEFLLNEPIHEYRLTALFMLVSKYKKAKIESEREDIVNVYVKNIEQVNNWDLVDSSAHLILGPHLFCSDTGLLYEFAKSKNLWVQRTAIIATLHFIRNNEFEETLQIAEMLINHKHDLIHKAVGWMLREVGNKDYDTEYTFLLNNYKNMPRTMLRYAIEKFPEDVRQGFLKGTL
jgi:3-methyladenine DNA glycosylase AlkD